MPMHELSCVSKCCGIVEENTRRVPGANGAAPPTARRNQPCAYALSLNLRRRQLSGSQRAMVGARIETFRHGGDRKSDHYADLHLHKAG